MNIRDSFGNSAERSGVCPVGPWGCPGGPPFFGVPQISQKRINRGETREYIDKRNQNLKVSWSTIFKLKKLLKSVPWFYSELFVKYYS